MNLRRQVTRTLPLLAFLGLIGVAVLGFASLKKDSEALDQASKENIVWAATQLENELLRFTNALSNYGYDTDEAVVSEIPRRFDLLWSRAAQFGSGEVGARLARYDRGTHAVARLNMLLRAHEPTLERLLRGDRDAVREMLEDFSALHGELHEISVRVVRGEEARLGGARERQRESIAITTLSSAAAVIFGVMIMFFLYRQVFRLERLADANLTLAEKAQRANEAKTRFLTMISHELRTPMNGVLGTLDLIAQSDLTRPQRRLVDQAGRSGRYMTRMLGDLIDVTALKTGDVAPDPRAVSVGAIARGADEQFAYLAKREGVRASMNVDDPRIRIEIDAHRFQQALGYVLEHLVSRIGATELHSRIWVDAGALKVRIGFLDARSDLSDPELHVLAREPAHSLNDIASDAFGPSVARDVIAFLGGDISVVKHGARSGQVLISAPINRLSERAQLTLRLDVRSDTVRALCEAVIKRSADLALCEVDDPSPDVLIAEVGGEDEAALAASVRGKYPEALFIALGMARDPSLFDAVIEGFISPADLRQAIAEASAQRGYEAIA